MTPHTGLPAEIEREELLKLCEHWLHDDGGAMVRLDDARPLLEWAKSILTAKLPGEIEEIRKRHDDNSYNDGDLLGSQESGTVRIQQAFEAGAQAHMDRATLLRHIDALTASRVTSSPAK